MTDFILPELGENITTGDVVRVLVRPGDTVSKEQPVLELETDKATIEVPSSVEGRVQDVKVKAGDRVNVGQTILTVEGEAGPAGAGGTGKAEESSGERARGSAKVVDIGRAPGSTTPGAKSATEEAPPAPASPSVRRLARELGVDINAVTGTGPGGRISADDLKAQVRGRLADGVGVGTGVVGTSVVGTGVAGTGVAGMRVATEPLPDFTRWGQVERRAMSAVRRRTAEHLSAAWTAIPHVTQHDRADITELEEARKRFTRQAEAGGATITMTGIAVKVVAAALKIFPQFNSSIDTAAGEIVLKKYINVGVAVDTDYGLLVPVVHNADQKSIVELSVELAALAEKARVKKLSLEEMQGGCFSVSNLGGLGGTSFTPIVNLPEVAVLGISRARMEPVYQRDTNTFAPRLMLPLSLSYDHRVIDGADGVRFLRWVVEALEEPFVLALQG